MENELSKEQLEYYAELNEKLKRLNENPDFIAWRDEIAKPLLAQWETALSDADKLPEVTLRANLKHYNTLKTLFYTWFENASLQPKVDRDIKKQINK